MFLACLFSGAPSPITLPLFYPGFTPSLSYWATGQISTLFLSFSFRVPGLYLSCAQCNTGSFQQGNSQWRVGQKYVWGDITLLIVTNRLRSESSPWSRRFWQRDCRCPTTNLCRHPHCCWRFDGHTVFFSPTPLSSSLDFILEVKLLQFWHMVAKLFFVVTRLVHKVALLSPL